MSVFIGGDTQGLEYNFFGKIPGSMIECPCRLLLGDINLKNLYSPDEFLKHSVELSQGSYDKVKEQNGQCVTYSTNCGKSRGLMVEVDLNPLCNAKFGGSREALESAIKGLDINIWASGSGDNVGKVGYEARFKVWNTKLEQWDDFGYPNYTESIRLIHRCLCEEKMYNFRVTDSNKIYILISSGYPSSATIPSTLNLDYINVKLTLARTPDKLMFTDSEGVKKNYLDVNLKDEWSVLLKGLSPVWVEKDTENKDRCIFKFYKNNMDRLDIRAGKKYQATGIGIQLGTRYKYQNWKINNFPIEKFNNMNYLLQQKNKKITCYWTDKNGFNKQEIPHNMPNDFYKMFIGNYETPTGQMDSFLERFNFFDYALANTDQEAEAILKGRNDIDVENSRLNELGAEFSNPNLCPELSDFHKEGATIEEKSISKLVISNTLSQENSHEQFGMSPMFQLLPNNRYELIIDCEVTNSCEILVLNHKTQYGVVIKSGMQLATGINKWTFTTTDNNCPTDSQFIRLDVNAWNSRLVVNSIELKRLD